jgi:hypothetical protein
MKKHFLPLLFTVAFLSSLTLPVFAATYSPGVTVGEYVKYGNFVGSGAGNEIFNDISYQQLQVTSVSGQDVTLLSTGQYKDGSAVPGNGTSVVWNVAAGTRDGITETQGPIIAGNLNQGESIPPQNTYTVNATEYRTYMGVNRSVNLLMVSVTTPDYTTSLSYVYDKASGMLLEASSETTSQEGSSSYSYSVIETNLFTANPTPTGGSIDPTIVYLAVIAIVIIVVVLAAILMLNRKKL